MLALPLEHYGLSLPCPPTNRARCRYTKLSRVLEYTTLKDLVEETVIVYDPNPVETVVSVRAIRLAVLGIHC